MDTAAATVPRLRAPGRIRRVTIVLPGVILLLLFAAVFAGSSLREGPNGARMGADIAMFLGAAKVLHAGGNPYNHRLLYTVESTWLARQHLPISGDPAIVRVGNPPLFLWALQPLTRLPFRAAAWLWIGGTYLLAGVAFLALLCGLGWSRVVIASVLFLLMPQVVLGVYPGNVDAVVFAGLVGSVVASARFPVMAGALGVAGWLKPQVALPALALILIFHAARPGRMLAAFAGATVLLTTLSLAAVGSSVMLDWMKSFITYSHDLHIQLGMPTLAGLYAPLPSWTARTVLSVTIFLAAGVLTVWWWRRDSPTRDLAGSAWLWVVWLLAAPYAHFHDEILLAIPLIAALGRNGRHITDGPAAIGWYLLLLSPIALLWMPDNVSLLGIPLVGVTVALFIQARRQQDGRAAESPA